MVSVQVRGVQQCDQRTDSSSRTFFPVYGPQLVCRTEGGTTQQQLVSPAWLANCLPAPAACVARCSMGCWPGLRSLTARLAGTLQTWTAPLKLRQWQACEAHELASRLQVWKDTTNCKLVHDLGSRSRYLLQVAGQGLHWHAVGLVLDQHCTLHAMGPGERALHETRCPEQDGVQAYTATVESLPTVPLLHQPGREPYDSLATRRSGSADVRH